MLVIITTVNYAYCYSKYMLSCNTDTVKYGNRAGFFFLQSCSISSLSAMYYSNYNNWLLTRY